MLRLVGIGALGNMLSPAAKHLSNNNPHGTFIRIYDHNPMNEHKQDRRKSWIEHGAKLVHTIEETIGQGDIDGVVICAGKNGDDVEIISKVVSVIKTNYSNSARPFILHLSTVSADFVESAQQVCNEVKIPYVNYPLTGGAKGALDATMLILCSGDPKLYDQVKPLLSVLGKPKFYNQDPTTAAKVKLIGHLMVFNGLLGMSSAITLQNKAINLDEQQQTDFFDFLNQGAGGSRQWDVALKPAVAQQQWQVGFLLPHAVIDALYAADLLIKSSMPQISIYPILFVAAAFSFLLQKESNKMLATQTILKALQSSTELDDFIEKNRNFDAKKFLNNILSTLPENLRSKAKLEISKDDFQ